MITLSRFVALKKHVQVKEDFKRLETQTYFRVEYLFRALKVLMNVKKLNGTA